MNGSSNAYATSIPPVDVDDALQYTPLSSVVPLPPGTLSTKIPRLSGR